MDVQFLHVKPWEHQLATYEKCKPKAFYGLFFECGSGKTRTAIDICRYKFMHHKRIIRTLVLAPLAALINWQEEFVMFGGARYKTEVLALAHSDKKKKLKAIQQHRGNIFVINHDALNVKELYQFMLDFKPEQIIVDESHLFKNGMAKRTKALLKLCKQPQLFYRWILTGTAILNSPLDIWTQFRILNENIFSPNFLVFRGQFMFDKNAKWAGKQGYFPDWEPLPDAYARMNKIIAKYADRVLTRDCLDLPPLVTIKHHVYMTPEQEKHYAEMREDYITFLESGEACSANIALVKSLRLQQLVCGVFKDEEGKIHKIPNNRIIELKNLLEEITPNHKVIVWSCFSEGIYDEIIKVFTALKIKWCKITGEEKTGEEKQAAKDQFQNDPETRAILCNQAAAGRAINLTQAPYAIYYAKNFNREHDKQSSHRNERGGSEIHKTLFRIDLITPNSIDEIITDALKEKEQMADAILDNIRRRI